MKSKEGLVGLENQTEHRDRERETEGMLEEVQYVSCGYWLGSESFARRDETLRHSKGTG